MMNERIETHAFDAARYIRSPEAAALYLAEALTIGPAAFLEALGEVARAKSMTELADRLGVTRQSLYRSLSASGHPDFSTIVAALDSYGLQLTITPKAAA
jgi:probable addiction module antidote protein